MFDYKEYHNSMDKFHKWFNRNEDEINCMLAENGADRELDFDYEAEAYALFVLTQGTDLFQCNKELP